jgi:hypothetical protein
MGRTRRSSRRLAPVHRAIWLAVSCVAVAAVVALAAGAARTLHASAPRALVVQEEGSTGDGEPTTSVTVLAISVTRYGFEPREMTVPAGEYLLYVRNETAESDLAVTAHGVARVPGHTDETPAGAAVAAPAPEPGPPEDLPIPLGRGRRFHERVVLRPGVTTLTEATRPGWVCRIDVAP